MYDDLLGKKKKKEKGTVIIQDCDWDDENKKVIVKSQKEIEVEIEEDGNIKAIQKNWNDIEPSQDIGQ